MLQVVLQFALVEYCQGQGMLTTIIDIVYKIKSPMVGGVSSEFTAWWSMIEAKRLGYKPIVPYIFIYLSTQFMFEFALLEYEKFI